MDVTYLSDETTQKEVRERSMMWVFPGRTYLIITLSYCGRLTKTGSVRITRKIRIILCVHIRVYLDVSADPYSLNRNSVK